MRRVIVRRSPVHGKGVFAMHALAAGERMPEYKGESPRGEMRCAVTSVKASKATRFFFGLSDGRVIDGSRGGNSARWLNHACAPNCETIEDESRIFIHTLRPIGAGEELFIEYLLATYDPLDEDVRAQYACRCAAVDCRHSMLADTA
jgi:SET domain-containing protein